jgi:hypothetical protein
MVMAMDMLVGRWYGGRALSPMEQKRHSSVWPHVHSESPETFVGVCLSVCHRACAFDCVCVCPVAPVLYACGYCVPSAVGSYNCEDRCKRLTVKIADFMFRHGMATLIRVCERGERPREQRRVLRV